MAKKIKIRKLNHTFDPILTNWNWPEAARKDAQLETEIELFLIKNDISYRFSHFWNPKTRGNRQGKKYLNYIIFYKDEDINLFKLMYADKLKVENYVV